MSTSASADYVNPAEPARVSRSGSQVRARSHAVMVRLSPDEHERFTVLADKYGWSLPHLMRLGVEAALLQEQIQAQHHPEAS